MNSQAINYSGLHYMIHSSDVAVLGPDDHLVAPSVDSAGFRLLVLSFKIETVGFRRASALTATKSTLKIIFDLIR